MILEVCVDDAAGLDAAVSGGADRVELCAALSAGGVTPSFGFMQLAATRPIPISVMIRPRSGDFVFGPIEVDLMKRDIDAARSSGCSGLVLGANLANGALDVPLLEQLCDYGEGMDLTLHRAFDVVPDFMEATEAAISLGFSRILTSGGARTALDGLETLSSIMPIAKDRISIMPGAGVRPQIVGAILDRLEISEIHASCSTNLDYRDETQLSFLGFTGPGRKRTDEATVRELKALISDHRKVDAVS